MVYKKRFFFCFFLCFFSYQPTYSHAVYVSVCNIYEKNGESYFSIRAFKDDVFDALGFNGYSYELTDKEEGLIVEYIKQNFIVLLDGEDKSLVLSRFVFEGSDYTETANLVFKLNEKMTNKKLKIKNTILFDVLEDQTNIVGVKINKTKRTLNFNKNKKEDWVQIN
tara:strand:+ start:290 stop:787 length:498 start_codon:yes stop_codon:yes gene_type:complete